MGSLTLEQKDLQERIYDAIDTKTMKYNISGDEGITVKLKITEEEQKTFFELNWEYVYQIDFDETGNLILSLCVEDLDIFWGNRAEGKKKKPD